jgi:hypothetical protein
MKGNNEGLRIKLKKRRKLRNFFEVRVPEILTKLNCS